MVAVGQLLQLLDEELGRTTPHNLVNLHKATKQKVTDVKCTVPVQASGHAPSKAKASSSFQPSLLQRPALPAELVLLGNSALQLGTQHVTRHELGRNR
jgi:hypothetical protein